ncbi:translation initiation factor 2 [Pseudomonas sp. MF4836]|uniref:translation initiation factor 2 n=1 Tax=Pseudomonas sp. MF4836 TaxID=1960827 RepID=UPI0009984F62|nr:translation initiation factor 2 [Pseudomonas sp. MF4836]OOV95523.1 translation initiation factor 2 [Pseudomonas sp. MF4836]
MKAFYPAVCLLICLSTALGAGPLLAAPTQDESARSAASGSKKPAANTPSASKKPAAAKPAANPKKAAKTKKRAPIASKSKSAREIAKTPLPPAKLDLSLPPEMVKHLQPIGTVAMPKREPLLPQMFGEKPKESSPFQLNGRLLSNEMQLQLRNEERRDVEGAALDFEFKQ